MEAAIEAAKAVKDKPSIIKLTDTIGFGSKLQGTGGVHGNPLKPDDAKAVKKLLSFPPACVRKLMSSGFDPESTFVVPDEVYIEGTFRTMNEKFRKEAHDTINRIAKQQTKECGGKLTIRIEKGYPVLYNDPKLTTFAKMAAEEFLGKKNVIDLNKRMTSEDFAYYSHKIPACFYRLGTGNKSKGITSSVHTSTFDIDENALVTGTGLMTWIALKQLAPQ